jgi:hypothetical protein
MIRNMRVVGLSVLVLWLTGCPGMMGEGQTTAATLRGDLEVPPVETPGTGEGTFRLNADQTELSFEIRASGLSGAVTAAHFHQAPPGEAGGVVNDLSDLVMETGGTVTITGVWDLSEENLAALLDGDLYVNLHTAANPAGELRAQIDFDSVEP